jgi:hypothetical protein
MEYNPEQIDEITEIVRTYGEISVFYRLVEEGIDPVTNAEKCIIAIGNYKRIVPGEIRQRLQINVGDLEKLCEKERNGILVRS